MKKSLIALAVAGVFAAPAFADTSNVNVYGKLHMAVSFVQDQPAATEDVQISSNASRIGFKGSEDLGGGLKGVWQLESGVNLDEQNGTLASRNSFLGVAGNFGTVILGNHDTPLKLVGRKVDLFGDTIADSRNVLGGGSDGRAQNVVAYISPNLSGFSFVGAYVTDFNGQAVTTTGDEVNNGAWNVNAAYENGPFYVGFGYGDGDIHDVLGVDEHWRVAGSFSFGDFRLVGQYDSLSALAPATNDFAGWMVGGEFKMGALVLKASYMDGEYDGAQADPNEWTVGADYNLSKRTSVYALYTAGEAVTLGGGAATSDRIGPAVAGGDISGFSLGIVHNF